MRAQIAPIEGAPDGLRFLGRKCAVGLATGQGLGIDPRPVPCVKAAHDEPVPVCVEQRQGEALVATRLLERIEANETDTTQRLLALGLEDGRSSGKLVQLGSHRVDLVDVGVEDPLEAPSPLSAGQSLQPVAQPADPASLDDDDEEEEHDEQTDSADEGSDVRLDERVEIDGSAPPAGSAGV
jgi:hypothetical protein